MDEALVGRNMEKLSKVLDLYEEKICKLLHPTDLHHIWENDLGNIS
jgi:hypothetical protein